LRENTGAGGGLQGGEPRRGPGARQPLAVGADETLRPRSGGTCGWAVPGDPPGTPPGVPEPGSPWLWARMRRCGLGAGGPAAGPSLGTPLGPRGGLSGGPTAAAPWVVLRVLCPDPLWGRGCCWLLLGCRAALELRRSQRCSRFRRRIRCPTACERCPSSTPAPWGSTSSPSCTPAHPVSTRHNAAT